MHVVIAVVAGPQSTSIVIAIGFTVLLLLHCIAFAIVVLLGIVILVDVNVCQVHAQVSEVIFLGLLMLHSCKPS